MRIASLFVTPALALTLTVACACGARAASSPLARPDVRAGLTPAQQVWFDRLLAGMDGSVNLANNIMRSNDSYSIGREGGNYTEALWVAYQATGDRRFLDRILALSQMARDSLRDAWRDGTTDGYTDWQWLIDPTNATYYGKDTNWLDESIASGNAALWMYAFHSNRGLDTRYAEAADFWRDWLENQFLAKWYQRAGGDPLVAWNTPFAAFYKPDTEPRSANWRMAWYLWKVTGNTFYRDRSDQIVAELSASQHVNPAHPAAWRWAKETSGTSQTWQLVNYANYYVRVTLEMNLEGMPYFSSDSVMKGFAGTFRDVVYASSLPGLTTMTNDVNGGGSTTYALYAFNGLSRWDTTGFLANLADRSITGAGNYAAGGLSKAARNDVYISAYALLALSPRGSTPALVTSFMVDPQADGSVRIAWELAPEPGDGGTLVFRVAENGVERTQVNDLPVSGPGAHEVVDATPYATGPLTYELVERGAAGDRSLGRMTAQRPGGPVLQPTLERNVPNPFRSSTSIRFALPQSTHVRLAILDAGGRELRVLEDASLPAGQYAREWDGRDTRGRAVSSGLYFYVVDTGSQRLVRRAVRVL